uniref:N-acetyltransferase domain-containing protein n=1 Tax=Fundulus heteroclitus TaxID=8078 RepID=A0A3Q2STB2_FUNHE
NHQDRPKMHLLTKISLTEPLFPSPHPSPFFSVQFSIREYKPSDEHVVMSLFHDGILEHVYPAFFKAMSNPDHIGIALSISMAGYVLGGSSYFQALLFGSLWAGLIYYCCHDIYNSYMMGRLSTDMADIQASYLENPDNGFWVAEADVNGVSNREFNQETGDRGYAHMRHAVVAFAWRRRSLGSQLTRKALDFSNYQCLTVLPYLGNMYALPGCKPTSKKKTASRIKACKDRCGLNEFHERTLDGWSSLAVRCTHHQRPSGINHSC